MKKLLIIGFVAVAAAIGLAAGKGDKVMTKSSDGTYVVNTTTICDAKGFKGATPLEVHIKKGKVVKVVALKNAETPAYFAKVNKYLIPLFTGKKLTDARTQADAQKVDGCTGATFSTRAVQKNIKAALDYYEKHK